MDDQPSLDGTTAFRMATPTEPSGADLVAHELDEFNERYRYLCDFLYARLRDIADKCKGDIVTLVSRLLFFFFGDFMTVLLLKGSLVVSEILGNSALLIL